MPHDAKQKDIFCKFWMSGYIFWALTVNSTYNLTSMSIERYLAIRNPLSYNDFTVRKRLPFVLTLVWCVGFLSTITMPLTSSVIQGECVVEGDMSNSNIRILSFVFSVSLDMIIPLIIMITVYVHMAVILRSNNNKTLSGGQSKI